MEGSSSQSLIELKFAKNMKNYAYLVYVLMGVLRSLVNEVRCGREMSVEVGVVICQ